jgi:hypothetical protein
LLRSGGLRNRKQAGSKQKGNRKQKESKQKGTEKKQKANGKKTEGKCANRSRTLVLTEAKPFMHSSDRVPWLAVRQLL